MAKNEVTAKRQRLSDVRAAYETAPGTFERVLGVEMMMLVLLQLLDGPSIACFVEVLARNKLWRGYLRHEALWMQMLVGRFGGRRSAGGDELKMVVRGDHIQLADPRFDEHEEFKDDEDQLQEGAVLTAEEIVSLKNSAMVSVSAALAAAESLPREIRDDEDLLMATEMIRMLPESWTFEGLSNTSLPVTTTATPAVRDILQIVHRFKQQVWAWTRARQNEVISQGREAPLLHSPGLNTFAFLNQATTTLVLSVACIELMEFLLTSEEWKRFADNVVIVQGDIGTVTEINGQAIDGIVFPTAARLSNPGIGSAAVVHRRAGEQLAAHIRDLRIRMNVGEVHATPGFGAGVGKLIHVVGPSRFQPLYQDLLQVTYINIMRAAQRENLQCVACVSVSTGNLGVPCQVGARAAMLGIKRFLTHEKWPGKIGIVCYEEQVFDAFTAEKKALIEAFNTVRSPRGQ